ncbi:MAG: chemotaxis protein CheW [Pseudomonadota bacterium]
MASLNQPTSRQGRSVGASEGKYLTFTLDREEYGIEIIKVKEIIGMMPITPIPRTPDFVRGVINLRGKVIPVVDLRSKFALDPTVATDHTCIIVVEARGAGGELAMGIVVDSVNEVANIRQEQIEATPSFGVRLDTQFIMGMAKAGEEVKVLLDIDQVLAGQELDCLAGAA